MRILIEEQPYEATNDILEVVGELGPTITVGGKVSVGYVGYYYNTSIKDCVFILPKVLLNEEGMVFGNHSPEKIVHLEDKENPLKDEERKFIYNLSVWIYRAISVFKERHPESKIVLYERMAQIGYGMRRLSNTFLDVLLSLEQFNRDNQDFFFFVIKNQHSGNNKINWTKTITHSQAFLQNGTPVYMNPVNKRRQVNFDEELMVIYFSILNYIHNEYGFPFDTECHYDLINEHQFLSYLNGMGKSRLQEIKYKYFSDKALELWELCYAFFDKARQIVVNTRQKEYLLVKSFEIVFEDVIDELLGGRNDELPTELQEQPDGKRVDHLYRYKSLIEADDEKVYYIGDSKYYKRNTPIGKEALYKQFTYARNVIQWNLDLFLDKEKLKEQKAERNTGTNILRDEITEGYNIIPNFFISAKQKDLQMHSDIEWVDRDNRDFTSRQFDNRLFDRDTLLVCHYDVNFLYVVSLYGRKNEGLKAIWRDKVKAQFREEIISFIESRFEFSVLEPKDGDLISAVNRNFKLLNGKIYHPSDSNNLLILALDKDSKYQFANLQLISDIEDDFYVYEYHLGLDPDSVKKDIEYQLWEMPVSMAAEDDVVAKSEDVDAVRQEKYKKYKNPSVLFGIYKDDAHLKWILKNKKYNVRFDKRVGAVKRTRQVTSAEYLVLYEFRNEKNYTVYKLGNKHYIWDAEKMKETGYEIKDGGDANKYYLYEILCETTELGKIDFNSILEKPRDVFRKSGMSEDDVKGTPIYVYKNELDNPLK